MQEVGDESAQRLIEEHHRLLRDSLSATGGEELQWLGDGLMVAFSSTADAVRCAIAMQLAAREQRGKHPLQIRVGLNVGEILQQDAGSGYFGTPVVIAKRLCDRAEAGQILCTSTVSGLLTGRQTFRFRDLGTCELKGIGEPVFISEVIYGDATAGKQAGVPPLAAVEGPASTPHEWTDERTRFEVQPGAEGFPASSKTPVKRTPFVGRQQELDELRPLLDQVVSGRGALVMVGGEPGVGKTRMAEELMVEAGRRNMTTLIGRCYEMEGTPPYIAFVELVEAAVRTVPPDALRSALGDSASEVAKLMPELRRVFPGIPRTPELPPEQERRYLFNGVRAFVTRAARARPLILVLDDLHWADEPTLLLLQHLAQQLHEMPALILGTYRDVELDVGRPLARVLEELLRQRLARDLVLKRLPEDDVAAMLKALSGQEPPSSLVQVVHSETEGNPFFVEEVFAHLDEEGRLRDHEGRWRSDLDVGELDVPRGVRLVIGRRLERVSEQTRRVLSVAAMIGRGFRFALLEDLAELGTDALLDSVEEAERAHLIVSNPEGSSAELRFAHELIRQTLLTGLSLPRRQRLHLRVAEAIERVHADSPEALAADLAHHLYQAGSAADAEKTLHYLTLAAEQATAASAFEEAVRRCEDALTLEPAKDLAARANLLRTRGLALRSLGRWDDALADWREALDAQEQLGNAEEVGRICWSICHHLDWHGGWLEGAEAARRGLAALGDRVSRDRCRLLALAGRLLSWNGSFAAGAEMIAQALAMAEQIGEPQLLGQVFLEKDLHHWVHLQHEEQAQAGQRAVELLRPSEALWDLTDALWTAQMGLADSGRFEEAARVGEELESVATRLGHQGALFFALRNRGFREFARTGSLDDLESFARRELDLCQGHGGLAGLIPLALVLQGRIHFARGRWEQALASFEEAAGLEAAGMLGGFGRSWLFLVKAYAGDRETVLGMWEEMRGDLPSRCERLTPRLYATLNFSIEGLAVLGERAEAAKLSPLVEDALRTLGPTTGSTDGRPMEIMAGIAASANGEWERAEAHFKAALRWSQEIPDRPAQPEALRWHATALLDRADAADPGPDSERDRTRARGLLAGALAMYRRSGMPRHVELTQALLARTSASRR